MTPPTPAGNSRPAAALAPGPAPVDHYENFPVASWLCPPALRPAVAALYHFARTADDLADEGEVPAGERLADLAAYRAELVACFADPAAAGPAGPSSAGKTPDPRWAHVFRPLSAAIARHGLPLAPMMDLLSAFEQDVVRTRDGRGYADRAELLDYCRRSANPVGRLMLHLFGVTSEAALRESDAVCSALQLINFWQDLSVDLPRNRFYIPEADRLAHPDPQALVTELCAWARGLMESGAGIAHRVPGRAGWELRAVVQGGLRTLDKVEALGAAAFQRRPALGAADLPVIAWRCLRMRRAM